MSSRDFINKYLYYALIFVLSLVCLFFLPMLGTEMGMEFILPNTVIGWVIFIVSNLCSATLNVLMFHFFIKQGKVNIKHDTAYIAANELLQEIEPQYVEKALSPREWHKKQYRNKGISIFVFTVIGTISFGQAILVFDLVKFLSQAITLIFGLVFGFMEMKAVEEFWTIEYPDYARARVKQIKEEEEQKRLEEEQKAKLSVMTPTQVPMSSISYQQIPVKEEGTQQPVVYLYPGMVPNTNNVLNQ